ncbi:MAG TPA: ABC transporter permease subunit [Candidatus Hydrogenedentes bacterium]|nr:ABC transporter permease subunit [Candidatus Hydrogenedentota bacterium]HRT18882.1 ABC transporter permease subunit [Candidatus Hydrogenedentota bacterium]HRT65607.1 ABC transporter permease subunit [Candidatus Hydrogenedentota bacterium]
MMRRIGRLERIARRLLLHAVLIGGSIVFAIPFIWLGSTSAKVADEMYPPRWLPQIPPRVVQSPYIQLRVNEKAEKPSRVTEENWKRMAAPIQTAITSRLVELSPALPEFFRPYLHEPDWAEGVFARLLKRMPDEVFEKSEEDAAAWFVKNLDADLAAEVFDAVYRRVAFSDVVFHGWDVRVEQPTDQNKFPWRIERGDVELVTRTEGLRRPAQEANYSFREQDTFVLGTILPLEMKPENLKKIVVSNHADRSWHELRLTVEMNGRKYCSAQAGFLGSDRWQDITWQFASDDDKSIKMKTWLRLDEAGPSSFNEPGKVKLTLECRQAKGFKAAWNKYMNNYRDALRMVPLWAYVKNSLILVVLNIAGQLLGSSLVAFSFARLRWPARDFCFMLVLATLMIPAQVTMIPVFLIFKSLGWYNTLKPLWVGSFFGSAFYIFLLRQFMKGIPSDLEDGAKIDGCGYLGIYAWIIVPLIKPALAAIAIFTFMGTWNDFMGPLIYLNDQRLYPLSLGLFALQVFQLGNYGLMMAASVLMTLPVIALFFAAQRHFIQGVTLTGIKG